MLTAWFQNSRVTFLNGPKIYIVVRIVISQRVVEYLLVSANLASPAFSQNRERGSIDNIFITERVFQTSKPHYLQNVLDC